MRKSKRSLMAIEQSGYRYKPTPTLTLKGAWLKEWGFTANLPVTVQCEDGKLVITPRVEVGHVMMAEMEDAYCKVYQGESIGTAAKGTSG